MAIYFTRPIERKALWGGTLLRDYFGYPWFGEQAGQAWAFSGQAEASTVIENGAYRGQTLRALWQTEPQLFRSRFAQLPVIISLVAPMEDLSIQIHPNAEVARAAGYPTGKNEAWYFLEAEAGGDIVYGHSARDEAQLRAMVAQDQWDALVQHLPVRTGDFVYLPAGILHALRKGSIVYEIQQATDVTYRFFDYHRRDAQGNERPLHLEQAIACVDYGLSQADAHPPTHTLRLPGAELTTFVSNESFCVQRLTVQAEQALRFSGYQLMTVVAGEGTADGEPVRRGSNFLLPALDTLTLRGNLTLMTTCEQGTEWLPDPSQG